MGFSDLLSSQPYDQPSLGTLYARLLLHDPKRTHYGSDDPVTGSVTIRFERSTGKVANFAELFGPLEVDITLKGTIRIVSSNSAISESSSQNDLVFVTKTAKLHTGPFRTEPGTERDFPFSINFPEHADAKHKTTVSAYQDAEGKWKFQQRLSDTTIEDLPPTLNSRKKDAIVKSDMLIRYGISLQVEMPGIDIRIINPTSEKEVLYDRPRVPAIAATMQSDQTTSFKQQLSVESKALIAPENRSSGFRNLFKSTGPLPKYVFDAICSGVPQHIFIGQPINFTLSLSTDWDQTTAIASNIPEVSLSSCRISLIANTRGKRSDQPSSGESHTSEVLKEKACEVTGLTSTTSGDVDVGTLSSVPSTFTHEDISREYKLKIALSFSALGQTMNVMRILSLTVHPPLLEDVADADVDESMGVTATGAEENTTPLPAYDTVLGDGPTPSYFDQREQ